MIVNERALALEDGDVGEGVKQEDDSKCARV
jgi:hypothetical protein